MAYSVQFSPAASRQFRRLTRALQERLQQGIDGLETEPRPSGVVKLKGESDTYRLRLGDYRVIYEIHDTVLRVLVLRVGHRREVYRG